MRTFVLLFLLYILFFSNNYAGEKGLKQGQVPPELSFFSPQESKMINYKGNDFKDNVFLIDFWASWCAPCIESIPHLNKLVEKYKDKNVKFISITYEPEYIAEKSLINHPMKSNVGLDEDFKMFRNYNAWAIPNIVLINSKGKIAGRIHPNKLSEDVINVLLKGGIPKVENTPENLFDPVKAEDYFRSFLKKQEKN